MASEWHPDLRRDVLPGRSAGFWGQLWLGAGVASLVLMILTLLASVHLPPAYLLAIGLAWFVCVLLFGGRFGGPLSWVEERRARAELSAGYSTQLGAAVADEIMVEVDVVDSRSGRVIRLAGERMPKAFFNDRQAFMRERVRQVRAVADGVAGPTGALSADE
jgi:hypothetical protein